MKTVINMLALAIGMTFASHASAAIITSYDIYNAAPSGFGSWSYIYSGSVTSTGSLVNLTDGSGTLNDGLIPASIINNQLFSKSGVSIVLRLGELTNVSGITIFGGVNRSNSIPGTLTGWSVTINGNTHALTSIATGAACPSGPCDDFVSLQGTGLETVSTKNITLSNFQGGTSYFNIAELTVSGVAAAVPEPGSLAILSLGLAGLASLRRRKNQGPDVMAPQC